MSKHMKVPNIGFGTIIKFFGRFHILADSPNLLSQKQV